MQTVDLVVNEIMESSRGFNKIVKEGFLRTEERIPGRN